MDLSPHLLPQWMHDFEAIWQMDLLSPSQFARFAEEKGVRLNRPENIKLLWQTGLLKADLIICSQALQQDDIQLLGIDVSGHYFYGDKRQLRLPNGLSDSVKGLPELPKEVALKFHPFRYYILAYLDSILRPSIHPIQELLHSDGCVNMLKRWQQELGEWTKSAQFLDTMKYHEDVVGLCIATEPCTYSHLFSTVKRPIHMDDDVFHSQVNEYRDKLLAHFLAIGQTSIEQARENLCFAARRLEPNEDVHRILRVTRSDLRIRRLKGKLGGAIYLLTMAEMLRRFAEVTFNIELPEEDDVAHGPFSRKLKEQEYGSIRLFDGNRRSVKLFLRDWGLDYGTRLRWYIEGDTELGALEWMFHTDSTIELVNLRGLVAEGKGRFLTFRENLLNDIKSQVFSFVSFDSDVSDNLSAVRRAAEVDEMCGGFFISYPDFEEMNFTLEELKIILWQIAVENGASANDKVSFDEATLPSTSFKNLLKSARSSTSFLGQTVKGRKWGEKLMEYAWNHHTMMIRESGKISDRPIIEAIFAAFRARDVDYHRTRRDYKVDPLNGRSVPRGIVPAEVHT